MITVVEAPLAEAVTEGILRPTRSDWSPTTPEARGVDVAAGPDWLERCAAQGELPVGSAAITDAGPLGCDFVIHLAVCSREEPVGSRSVGSALRNGLRRATEWDVRTITAPLLGTGPGGLEPRAACALMRPLLASWVEGGEGREVRIAAEDPADVAAGRVEWGGG